MLYILKEISLFFALNTLSQASAKEHHQPEITDSLKQRLISLKKK